MEYPATLQINTPDRIANWRPLVQWLLAIPHYIVAAVLGIVSTLAHIVAWLAVLFTGRLPAGIAGFQSMYTRYVARVGAYASFLTDQYPSFEFTASPEEPGGSATSVSFSPKLTGRNRLSVLFRFGVPLAAVVQASNSVDVPWLVALVALVLAVLLIPAWIHYAVVGIVATVCAILGFFVVLVTGSWPDGLRRFVGH